MLLYRVKINLKRQILAKIPKLRREQSFQIGVRVNVQISSTIEHSETRNHSHKSKTMVAVIIAKKKIQYRKKDRNLWRKIFLIFYL